VRSTPTQAVIAIAVALVLLALALPVRARADTGGAGQFENPAIGKHSPFLRQGMWIWYVDQSQGGSVSAILENAHRHQIGTVYIKAGDGTTTWDQFNPTIVSELHRGGLKVCAWQFVYGDHPAAEAQIGAEAVADGADCLVIDAEAEYEGKYASADLHLSRLRAAIGANYPLSLAGFPYVDYHPAFPYSVFLGPGGATINQPQMYWKDIGTSVGEVFAHSYLYNRVWGRPIFPVGQTYGGPGRTPLRLFRRYSATYGTVPSWWDWQETSVPEWGALGARIGHRPLPAVDAEVEYPLLKIGAKGDLVVEAQERLVTAGQEIEVNGLFNRAMRRAVRAFQEAQGMAGDGRLGTETWVRLMNYTPTPVNWAATASTASSLMSGPLAGTAPRPLAAHAPLSATLPPVRDELAP
jgi:Putative peptidoglycan binding domain